MDWLRLWGIFSRPGFLLFALGLLHAGLLQGVTTPIGKSFLLGHFGAMLLWQPMVSRKRRFSSGELLLGALALLALAFWMTPSIVLLWIFALTGAIGGRVFLYSQWRERFPFWLALIYLAIASVGLVVPEILKGIVYVPELLPVAAAWAPLPLAALVLFIGVPADAPREAAPLDLAGGVVLVFVLMAVLLGAMVLMFVARVGYIPALMEALAIVAGQLLLLAWLWGPRRGLGGMGLSLMRKILSGNAPFENWLSSVADMALREESPEGLVRQALKEMSTWSFIRGLRWRIVREEHGVVEDESHLLGTMTPFRTRLRKGAIDVEVFTPWALGPTPFWQLDIMVRILAEFHAARMQARRLQALTYLQAVHETGARVTHEVKNLLQSLDTLCFAVSSAEQRSPAEVQAMLSRQLPVISARLHHALDEIRRPRREDLKATSAADWWAAFQERSDDRRITFRSEGAVTGAELYGALFDLVSDNLLRNALHKDSCGQVDVILKVDEAGCVLLIQDDGSAIAPDRAAQLFVIPLQSETGLGIGLYQACRLAESVGFRLTLDENRDGAVRFRLGPLP